MSERAESTWVATYRVTIRDLIEHDEPGAEWIARDVIEEEGLLSVCDMDDFELVSLEPVSKKEGA